MIFGRIALFINVLIKLKDIMAFPLDQQLRFMIEECFECWVPVGS